MHRFHRNLRQIRSFPTGRQSRPPLREGEIKPLTHSARGFCDRVYKPGSVIDSHLSRRIVAGALQPPPRKQPGKPCFLHGVAPDRVYSNGRFHADACALTARFHPYLVGANFISFASPQAAKLIHSVAPPLPSKQGFAGFWGRKNFISFALPQEAKLVHSILPPLPSKRGFAGFSRKQETLLRFPALVYGRGGIFLLHFSSDRSGRALPVILALWSPDFPHDAAVGPHPATVRPGRAFIVLDWARNVKQVAIFF